MEARILRHVGETGRPIKRTETHRPRKYNKQQITTLREYLKSREGLSGYIACISNNYFPNILDKMVSRHWWVEFQLFAKLKSVNFQNSFLLSNGGYVKPFGNHQNIPRVLLPYLLVHCPQYQYVIVHVEMLNVSILLASDKMWHCFLSN